MRVVRKASALEAFATLSGGRFGIIPGSLASSHLLARHRTLLCLPSALPSATSSLCRSLRPLLLAGLLIKTAFGEPPRAFWMKTHPLECAN